jgi:hypothetical protein
VSTPANIPVGRTLLCTNTIRWRVKDGDFDGTGAGSSLQKPMWQFNGGGLSDPDLNDVAAQWFFAPYFDSVTNTASLGMYFKASGFDRSWYRTFPRQSHRFKECTNG